MTTVSYRVEGMACPSCVQKIEVAVGRLAGVGEVKVLFNAAKVKASFDEKRISAEAIATAISKLGYEAVIAK